MEEELLGAGVFAAYEAPEWGSAEHGDLTAVGLFTQSHCGISGAGKSNNFVCSLQLTSLKI